MNSITPALTKKRRFASLGLLAELRQAGVPDLITAQEAANLADANGTPVNKYRTMRTGKPIRLIDLAVYIARWTR